MGIPFYFASLVKSHTGIVEPVKKDMPLSVDVLGIDFNCLIHRYLKDDQPVSSVLDALEHILSTVCKPKKVLLAIDGLVPYGKIVQQRYRRMRTKEEGGTFDRNLISPDTPYMRELEEGIRSRFPNIILSGSTEAGEGEHKIFCMLRELPENERRSVCIYGLDADLILICLQHHKVSYPYSMWLLRESAEFNDPKLSKAEFATLSIWKLIKTLPLDIQQYVALMVLCFGNDFMPTLGMFSLREDGYSRALQYYELCDKPNLFTKEGRSKFLKYAASNEREVYRERISLRKRPEEKAIFGKEPAMFSRKYNLHVLDGVSDVKPVVESFWNTFHWTLAYFMTNKPTNWDWVYPYPEAPLVSDIVKYEETNSLLETECNFSIKDQLSFILPRASIRLAKSKVRFSDEIYSETREPWMKRHEWETKPRISLPWNPSYLLTEVEQLS